MYKEQKPIRKYKNLQEYNDGRSLTCKKHKWPCLACDGYGRIYDPDDPPCPIEGNKMRNKLKCQICSGTGAGTKEEVMQEYKEYIKNFKLQLSKYNELLKHKKSALKKLTQQEIKALKNLGF